MKNKINNYLNCSYPLFLSERQGWCYLMRAVLIFGVLINVLQPFGTDRWQEPHKWMILSGYGGIYAFVYALKYKVLSTIYPQHYKPDSWTLRKEFCLFPLFFPVVCLVSCVYTAFVVCSPMLTRTLFIHIQLDVLFVGVLSVFSFGCFIRSRHDVFFPVVSNGSSVAGELQPSTVDPPVFITCGKKTINTSRVIYIECSGNHAIIYLRHNERLERVAVACTFKELELILAPYLHLPRCHGSFFVNLHEVHSWRNNGHGLDLTLRNGERTIPVSKRHEKKMKDHFTDYSIFNA